MGTSTFCKWAVEHDDPLSHARCRSEDCECGCHEPTSTAVAAGSGYAAEQLRYLNASAARPARRTYTDGDKARIIDDYTAAPRGTRKAVLARHGVTRTMVERWANKAGVSLTPATTRVVIYNTDPEPEPSVLVEDDDIDELVVALDPGDRDVLDALAWLTDTDGGAATFVAQLVNDTIAAHRDDPAIHALRSARATYKERTVG